LCVLACISITTEGNGLKLERFVPFRTILCIHIGKHYYTQ
jgi:hypothetical protein